MSIIDVHCHVCPGDFPPAPGARRWPCMVCGAADARTLTFDEKPFRALDARSWDLSRRLEDMDREGVGIQVLSPMPELLAYWLPIEAAEALCDHVNGFIAGLVARGGGRFRGLGMAPLQDPARAVAYLPRLRLVFGLDGLEIGSNVGGRLLGDVELDPVFGAASAAGLAVFVHALHPLAPAAGSPQYLVNGAGFPLDVALAGSSLITTGLLSRYPDLRVCFSHGGGALHALAPRLDKVWRLSDGFEGASPEPPSETIRRFFYDSNVYSPSALSDLARSAAPAQICVGTDYPYRIQQTDIGAYLASADLSASQFESLTHGAARRFLQLA
jgi:aminocarboxymuconate-semialdehyde decarboxylase